MVALATPQPAGFGRCRYCAFRETGTPEICYECASKTIRVPSDSRCKVCSQELGNRAVSCSNELCNDPERAFDYAIVIAMNTGELENAIKKAKDPNRWGWCWIFARVVVGYLHKNPQVLHGLDAIIPMPAWPPASTRPEDDRTMIVIRKALEQDPSLPFVTDPPLIEKQHLTKKMRFTTGLHERREEGDRLYRSLSISDVTRVQGRRIMVYDDVLTSGTTLNAVAKKLCDAGAESVIGLALARQAWGSRG